MWRNGGSDDGAASLRDDGAASLRDDGFVGEMLQARLH